MSDRWLTPKEAAEYVGLSTRTLRRAVTYGTLKAGRSITGSGNRRAMRARFKMSQLDRWLENGVKEAA